MTEEMTMEERARKLRDRLESTIERVSRLRSLGDRGEEAGDTLAEQELDYLSADIEITIDVTLYTGGPAGGVEFKCYRDGSYLELDTARVWHQDWFKAKGYAPLDNDTAQCLWYTWGLGSMELES